MTCATVWRSPFEPTAAAERCLQRAFHQFVPSNGASLGQMSIGRDLAGLPKAGLEEKADRLLELELIRLALAESGNLICDGHGRHRAEILERAAEGTNRQQSPTARWTRSGPARAEQWRRAHRCSRRRQRPHHWGLLQITTHLHAQLRRSRPVPGLQRHETLARRASSNEPDSSTPPPEAPQCHMGAPAHDGMRPRQSCLMGPSETQFVSCCGLYCSHSDGTYFIDYRCCRPGAAGRRSQFRSAPARGRGSSGRRTAPDSCGSPASCRSSWPPAPVLGR